MSRNRSTSNRDERGGGGYSSSAAADEPPMSRLFIICNKANTEADFRDAFEKFGKIEEIWVVKDKLTGENKGKLKKFGLYESGTLYMIVVFFCCCVCL